MARSRLERLRMILSRIVCGAVILLVLFGRSAWENSLVGGALFGAGCLLVGLGTIGRIWASLHIAGRKTSALVVTGPYSICRNPLYFFSLLGGLGIALATRTFLIPLILLAFFALFYPWVIRSEEQRLREGHGPAFDDYCRTTPAFWPDFRRLREDSTCEVNAVIFRRQLTDGLWFIFFVGALGIVAKLHELGLVPTYVRLH